MLCGLTTSSKCGFVETGLAYDVDTPLEGKENGRLLVVEELTDHVSSSGAKSAAGCATSSPKDINVDDDVVVLFVVLVVVVVVDVVVLRALRPPSCLPPRSAKTIAPFPGPKGKKKGTINIHVYNVGVVIINVENNLSM